jgi:hypothetical protein
MSKNDHAAKRAARASARNDAGQRAGAGAPNNGRAETMLVK